MAASRAFPGARLARAWRPRSPVGNADKLSDLLRVLDPFGIRELVQSGMVAIGRGSRSISERTLRPVTTPAPPAVS